MRCVLALACLASPALADSTDPPPPAHTMFALGFTPGGASRHTPTGIITPLVYTLEIGIRLADHLAIVAGTDAEASDSKDVDAGHDLARLGLRWYPFDSNRKLFRFPARYFDSAAVHIEGRLGVDVRYDQPDAMVRTASHTGFLFAASIGWLPFQGNDYAVGVDYTISGTRFRDEYEHEYALLFVAELY